VRKTQFSISHVSQSLRAFYGQAWPSLTKISQNIDLTRWSVQSRNPVSHYMYEAPANFLCNATDDSTSFRLSQCKYLLQNLLRGS
jgi:hypothetical protein